MKSQRTYEVRTRPAVVIAIKAAAEDAGIDIPADTTISFAETLLTVEQERQPKARKKPAKDKPKAKIKSTEGEAALAKPADGSIPKRKCRNRATSTKASKTCRVD